jgi:S1-C subfamily serine protease
MTGCSQAAPMSQISPSETISNPASMATPTVLYDESTLVSLYQSAIQSVIKIEAVVKKESQTIGPFQFGPFQREGQGSGFIIDKDGHILTNNHVVDGASSVKVTLHNGNVIDAKIVGTNRENDLALLKVDSDKLGNITPLPLGDSDKVKPGQMAIALGSPFGLEGSITVGIISAIGRSIPSTTQRLITDTLQTDAAINPGNSGGPLLNSKGEVIGINTAIEASANGIGFAVPINTAKSLLPALLKGGEVSSPWLGIKGVAINHELASKLDLPTSSGVYVIEVTTDSPAEKAGLRGSGTNEQGQPTFGGDIITSVDGRTVTKVEDLTAYFNSKKPGDEVSLSIYRGDKNLTIEATLGEWPKQTPLSLDPVLPDEFKWGPFYWRWQNP